MAWRISSRLAPQGTTAVFILTPIPRSRRQHLTRARSAARRSWRDLRDAKQKALDHCTGLGLIVTLVATIERGLNDSELGQSSASASPTRR
jgi:hypothetical protein